MNLANIAKRAERLSQRLGGEPVTVDGTACFALVRALDASTTPENIPDGTLDAANADPLVFEVEARYFASIPSDEGTIIRGSVTYTRLRVIAPRVAGVDVSYQMIAYRKPQIGSSSEDSAQLEKFAYVPPT